MRAIADRNLSEPFRSWIDRRLPLPDQVRMLPRSLLVTHNILMFLMISVLIGGMGSVMLGLFASTLVINNNTDWFGILFLCCIGLGLWFFPLLLLRRAWITFWAWNDQKRDRLRQGILIGPEGILVRLEPNWCYPIALDRYVAAKVYSPHGDHSNPYFQIETLDGPVEFYPEWLDAMPDDVERTVREFRPASPKVKRPKPERRADRAAARKFTAGAVLFAAGMLLTGGAILGIILAGQNAPDALLLLLMTGLLVVFASVINLVYRFLSIRLYRCPQCRQRLPQVHEACPAIIYYCAACNVEWDTGLHEARSGFD